MCSDATESRCRNGSSLLAKGNRRARPGLGACWELLGEEEDKDRRLEGLLARERSKTSCDHGKEC